MGMFGRITICVVCGTRLPEMTFQGYRDKGMATITQDGAELHHCAGRHSMDEIRKMARAVPIFMTGSTYKRFITDK